MTIDISDPFPIIEMALPDCSNVQRDEMIIQLLTEIASLREDRATQARAIAGLTEHDEARDTRLRDAVAAAYRAIDAIYREAK